MVEFDSPAHIHVNVAVKHAPLKHDLVFTYNEHIASEAYVTDDDIFSQTELALCSYERTSLTVEDGRSLKVEPEMRAWFQHGAETLHPSITSLVKQFEPDTNMAKQLCAKLYDALSKGNRTSECFAGTVRPVKAGYVIVPPPPSSEIVVPPATNLFATHAGRTIAEMRASDGFINATKMCKEGGKLCADFLRRDGTRQILAEIENTMACAIVDLVQVKMGGNTSAPDYGTWVHPKVAIHLAMWVSPAFGVAVSDLVLRYMSGNVTTAESVRAAEVIAEVVRVVQDTTTAPEPRKRKSNDMSFQPAIAWENAFTFDPRNLNKPGLYLNRMVGVVLDVPVSDDHIIAKIGKAVDQPISARELAHANLHPENRVVFAIVATNPSLAENQLKVFTRNRGMLKKGKYSDGNRGTEFIAFLPDDAGAVRNMFEMACESEVVPMESEALLLSREETERARLETERRRMDLEILRDPAIRSFLIK